MAAEKRAVRKSLINTNYPSLVEAYQEGKVQKIPTTPAKKGRGKRKEIKMRPLDDYFASSKYVLALMIGKPFS